MYHWTVDARERETLHLLATKLCVPPHPSFFDRFGHHKPHQPDLVCALLEKEEALAASTEGAVVLDMTDSERTELLHELNHLVERMEHENNNLAFVPTDSNPAGDFWDFFDHAQELASALTVLQSEPEA